MQNAQLCKQKPDRNGLKKVVSNTNKDQKETDRNNSCAKQKMFEKGQKIAKSSTAKKKNRKQSNTYDQQEVI